MITEALQEIETSIQHSKQLADLGKSLERLANNRDFKAVFMSGYFEREAIRLVHLKSDPAMESSTRQQSIDNQIMAIGHVSAYLGEIRRQANLALKQLEQDEAMRDELLAEEVQTGEAA
jgi:hypothetical protein